MSWWLSFSQTQFIKLIFRKSLSRTAVCANSSLNDINFIIDKNRRLTKLFFFHKTPHLGFVDRFHSRTHDKKKMLRDWSEIGRKTNLIWSFRDITYTCSFLSLNLFSHSATYRFCHHYHHCKVYAQLLDKLFPL